MRLSNREIRRRYSALQTLASRILPSRQAELKVAKLLRAYFDEPFRITEDMNQKIITKEFPTPEDAEGGIPTGLILEQRQKALNEMLELEQDVRDVPDHLLITDNDLPKTLKGQDANQAGVAEIMASLGSLYKPFKELEENKDEESEEE